MSGTYTSTEFGASPQSWRRYSTYSVIRSSPGEAARGIGALTRPTRRRYFRKPDSAACLYFRRGGSLPGVRFRNAATCDSLIASTVM